MNRWCDYEGSFVCSCPLPTFHTIKTVDGYGATHAKDGMPTGLNDAIVGHGNESAMTKSLSIEIGGIVVIATNEDYPVVGFRHTTTVLLHHLVVIARIVEAKAAITSHNEQSVAHSVLYTELMHELVELAMYVARYQHALGIRETQCIYAICLLHKHYKDSEKVLF